MDIYGLYSKCQTLLAAPFNFSSNHAIDEEKIFEALSPLYTVLRDDDTLEGFAKWIMVPLYVAFGEVAFSEEGLKTLKEDAQLQNKIRINSEIFSVSKEAYLKRHNIIDLTDDWDFTKFAVSDIADVGKAFLLAFEFKKVKIV